MGLLDDAAAVDRVAGLHELVAAKLDEGEPLTHDAVVLRRAAEFTRDFHSVLSGMFTDEVAARREL